MDATSEVFRGFVFTHRNLLPSVWKALRDHRLPEAGATAWEDPSARGARKRARGGSGGPAPPIPSPTHVILTDRADADTRALAARQYPDAILVTQTWVFDRLAGKPEAGPRGGGGGAAGGAGRAAPLGGLQLLEVPLGDDA
jgi:hypothetical protein